MSKKDVYYGKLSKYSYDKLENDVKQALINDFLNVLPRLGISINEYLYITEYSYHDTNYNFIKDIKNLEISSNEKYLIRLIRKYKYINNNVYNLLKSIYYIHHDNFDMASKFGYKIWENMENYDDYTPSEIFLLSHIFYLFPLNQSIGIIKILKKKLEIYRDFDEFYKTEIIFYLNAGRYMMDFNKEKSMNFFSKALSLSIKSENAKYTAISYIRLGDITNNTDYIKKGKYLLEIFSPKLWHHIKKDLVNF